MRRNLFLILLLFVMVAFIGEPSLARADSISPSTFTGSGPTGASYTVNKTVTITEAGDLVESYNKVSLDTTEVPTEVGVAVTPNAYSGDFNREIERTFGFEVTFTDLEPGTHTFNIYALLNDQFRVATESDSITSTSVPEPATMLLLGSGLIGLWGLRRKFKK